MLPPVTGVAATGAGMVAGPTGSKALGSVDSGGGLRGGRGTRADVRSGGKRSGWKMVGE